jgi:UDP-N-acetylmuramate dehydrogenase
MIAVAAREALEEALGDRIRFDVPMSRYTSLRVGGPADALASPSSRADLAQLLAVCNAQRLPHAVLGAGFNTLALDHRIEGVVIQMSRLRRLEERPGGLLRAEVGVSHAQLTNFCCRRGLAGLEFGAGIPGSVGGWLAMNAGIPEREVKDVVREIEVMSPTGRRVRCADWLRGRCCCRRCSKSASRHRPRFGRKWSACSPGAPGRSLSTSPPADRCSRTHPATSLAG